MFEAILDELIVGLLSAVLIAAVGATFRHRQFLGRAIKCHTVFRNRKLRVSMSAILRIHKDGEFILILNRYRQERFGPIGGVYKYHSSAVRELGQLGFIPDRPVEDRDLDHDLRGLIVGKQYPSFYRWFCSGKNRETDAIRRELAEELQEVGLHELVDDAGRAKFEYIRTVDEGPRFVSASTEYDAQARRFDIFELCADDEATESITTRLFLEARKGHPEVISVSAKEIRKRRSKRRKLIASHSSYLLLDSTDEAAEPPPIA